MSQHKVIDDNIVWIFGWDQPLQSFFLQVRNRELDEEQNPVVWLVNDMYEVEDLVRAAKETGLAIDYPMQVKLYGEKDEGL